MRSIRPGSGFIPGLLGPLLHVRRLGRPLPEGKHGGSSACNIGGGTGVERSGMEYHKSLPSAGSHDRRQLGQQQATRLQLRVPLQPCAGERGGGGYAGLERQSVGGCI